MALSRDAIRCVVTVMAAVVAGCAGIKTDYTYQQSFDFSPYRTFSWVSDEPLLVVSPLVNPLVADLVERAVHDELTSKGFRFVEDRSRADFVVGFTVGSRSEISVETNIGEGFTYAAGSWAVGYYDEVDVEQYSEGRLAIDLFDAKLRHPVWHGYATKGVTGADQANAEAVIRDVVGRILAHFPPDR